MKKQTFSLFVVALFLLAGCQSPPTEPVAESTASPVPTATSLPPSATAEPQLSAVLHEVVGDVKVATDAAADFLPAQEGTTFLEGGRVRTFEDGYTRIDLSTGSLLRMAPHSEFTLLADEGEQTHAKLNFGQIWIILNGGSLDVETPTGIAAVRGSYMMVIVDPDEEKTLVTCLEGSCSWQRGDQIIEFFSGERIIMHFSALGEDLALPDIEKMQERDFAEWLYFVPEAQDIFPFLEEEGILPWENWREIIPQTDNLLSEFNELFPEVDESLLPNCIAEGNCLPDLDLNPNGSIVPEGEIRTSVQR